MSFKPQGVLQGGLFCSKIMYTTGMLLLIFIISGKSINKNTEDWLLLKLGLLVNKQFIGLKLVSGIQI